MFIKILEYLFEKVENKNIICFNKQDLTLLLNTRFIGISDILEKQGYLTFTNELKNIIEEIKKVNYVRNINLLNESLVTDIILEKYQIKRTWFKGIADVYVTPSLLSTRKLSDSDVIVDNVELVREILIKNNFRHGKLDRQGKWLTIDREEMKLIESTHYEIFPLSKVIEIPILKPKINEELLNRYRIFKHKDLDGYYSDFCLDVHHSFTIGLRPTWMLKQGIGFPIINKIDDLWYSINKAYYEVILGNSIDLQLLFKTIIKIKQANYNIDNIINRLKIKESEFLNEEAFFCLFDLSNGDICDNKLNMYLKNLKQNILSRNQKAEDS